MGIEVLIAAVVGLVIGCIALVFAKPADTFGRYLLPALGGAVALVFWTIAAWATKLLGWTWLRFDQPLAWILLVAITLAACLSFAFIVPTRREFEDTDLYERLSHRGSVSVK